MRFIKYSVNDTGDLIDDDTGEILIADMEPADALKLILSLQTDKKASELAGEETFTLLEEEKARVDVLQISLKNLQSEREREALAEPQEEMPPEIAAAVIQVMSEVNRVPKSGYNKHHNYHFPTESDIAEVVRPAMAKAGILFTQQEGRASLTGPTNNVLKIVYDFTFIHSSGKRWPTKRPIQVTGLSHFLMSQGGIDDKAYNKARQGARKFFTISAFQISSGEDDPDASGESGQSGKTTTPSGQSQTAAKATQTTVPADQGQAEAIAAHNKIKKYITEVTQLHELEGMDERFKPELAIIWKQDQTLHKGLLERLKKKREIVRNQQPAADTDAKIDTPDTTEEAREPGADE